MRFASAVVPLWARKTPAVTGVLLLLCLHGLSLGGVVLALGQFLGSAAGLLPAVITGLTGTWQAGRRAFAARDLSHVGCVCRWAGGILVNIRREEHQLGLLVMIGVRAGGRQELIALAGGTGSPPGPGPACGATAPAAACAPRCWPPGWGRGGSGTGCGRCSPRPGRAGAGSARPPALWPRCRSLLTRGRRRHVRRSGAPRASSTPSPPSGPSRAPAGRRSPRPPRRSPMTVTSCWRSAAPRASTGSSHQPDRACLRGRQAPGQGHPGARLPGRGPGDGVHAHRISPGPLPRRARTSPGRPGPRRHLPRRCPGRTPHGTAGRTHAHRILTIARDVRAGTAGSAMPDGARGARR